MGGRLLIFEQISTPYGLIPYPTFINFWPIYHPIWLFHPLHLFRLTYPYKLQCTEAELLEDFEKIWPVLNKLWLSFKNTLPRKNVTQRFWVKVLEEYSLDFPNIAELILILLAISTGTGPLERSYSKLAKTYYKDRARLSPDTLEVLYLLCTLWLCIAL